MFFAFLKTADSVRLQFLFFRFYSVRLQFLFFFSFFKTAVLNTVLHFLFVSV